MFEKMKTWFVNEAGRDEDVLFEWLLQKGENKSESFFWLTISARKIAYFAESPGGR